MGVGNEEMETYNFLKNVDQNSLILLLNNNNFDQSSPLVYVLTGKKMFLSGQRVLRDHSTLNMDRVQAVEKMRNTEDVNVFLRTARKYNIDYVYLYKNDSIKLDLKKIERYNVFENKVALIFKL